VLPQPRRRLPVRLLDPRRAQGHRGAPRPLPAALRGAVLRARGGPALLREPRRGLRVPGRRALLDLRPATAPVLDLPVLAGAAGEPQHVGGRCGIILPRRRSGPRARPRRDPPSGRPFGRLSPPAEAPRAPRGTMSDTVRYLSS